MFDLFVLGGAARLFYHLVSSSFYHLLFITVIVHNSDKCGE